MTPAILAFAAALSGPIELRTPAGETARFELSGAPATVVIFISTVCPISNDYHDRFEALRREQEPRGVRVLFVYSNYREPPAEIARHAVASRFSFPVYVDADQRLADALEAKFTPTAVVLDRSGEVRYVGAIDDSVYPARVKDRYAARAIDAVLAGREPAPARTDAAG
ncbi:MAG: redoxin family protein [Bryobacteraceae bacterium]